MNRIDFIFSYWILVWFILYYFFNWKEYNPLFLLIIGLIVNLYMLINYIINENYYKGILFSFVNFFIKILKIYLLLDIKIKIKDIIFSLLLFIFFLFYYKIINFNYLNQIKKKNYSTKEIDHPTMYFLNKFILYLNNLIFKEI